MTHLFQPLDLTVNDYSKQFMKQKFVEWYANNRVATVRIFCDKLVIFAESQDKVRILLNYSKFLLSHCLDLGMKWKGLVSIFLKNR